MKVLQKRRTNEVIDFTTGSIFEKLFRFMMPIIGAIVLQTMYGAADIFIVGWFGTPVSTSAVSTGSTLINMVIFIINGLAMGVTILMGRYIGERKKERLNSVVGSAIFIFFIIGILTTLVLLLFAPHFCSLLNTPNPAQAETIAYIRICGGGIIFTIGYNLISNVFRGVGNSKFPLFFVGVACVMNVLLDLLFVAGFHKGVVGAACATVISQAFSLFLSIWYCKKKELPFRLSLKDIRPNREIGRFLLFGLPIAFHELLTQISFLCLLAFANGMGTTHAIQLASSSGYGVANKITSIILLVPVALMQSVSAFIAQNVAAGKEKRAQQAMGYGMLIGGAIGVFMTAIAFFWGEELATILTKVPAYRMKAVEYLQGFSLEGILSSILFSFIGYFNGHHKTVFVMIQGLFQSLLIRIPVAYIAAVEATDSMVYIGASAPAATFGGIILSLIFYLYCTKDAFIGKSQTISKE